MTTFLLAAVLAAMLLVGALLVWDARTYQRVHDEIYGEEEN